jgi:hypothetical protein
VMAASIVINTLMVQGQFGVLAERFRHWGVVARPATPSGEALPSDHAK